VLTKVLETDIIFSTSKISNSYDQEKDTVGLYSRELANGVMPTIKGYVILTCELLT